MQTMGNAVFFQCAKNQKKILIMRGVANKRMPPCRQKSVCMLITVLCITHSSLCRGPQRCNSDVPTFEILLLQKSEKILPL